jgi:hypothetical protein
MKSMQELLPSWNDPGKAAGHRKALRDYAVSHGFKDNEIANFSKDPRVVLAMMKAAMFDQIMAKPKGGK